jgi:secondary thiamine-phosphate synthase enzyme
VGFRRSPLLIYDASMPIHQKTLEIRTPGRGFVDLTPEIGRVVRESGVKLGLCTIFVQHTSASLLIQENADPAVLRDLARWFGEIAPESRRWEHDDEGPDDMPAHARSALTRTSEVVPIKDGRLALGTWQAVYLWEHRARPHSRRVLVHVSGEP